MLNRFYQLLGLRELIFEDKGGDEFSPIVVHSIGYEKNNGHKFLARRSTGYVVHIIPEANLRELRGGRIRANYVRDRSTRHALLWERPIFPILRLASKGAD